MSKLCTIEVHMYLYLKRIRNSPNEKPQISSLIQLGKERKFSQVNQFLQSSAFLESK